MYFIVKVEGIRAMNIDWPRSMSIACWWGVRPLSSSLYGCVEEGSSDRLSSPRLWFDVLKWCTNSCHISPLLDLGTPGVANKVTWHNAPSSNQPRITGRYPVRLYPGITRPEELDLSANRRQGANKLEKLNWQTGEQSYGSISEEQQVMSYCVISVIT